MAGRIKIEPYKPLDVHTPPVPGGGYIQVDASAGKFEPSPLARLGLEMAQGLPSAVQAVSAQLARDDEAAVKDADARLGEAEQALLFDPQHGYFNTQGQDAVEQAATVLNAYSQAQTRETEDLPNEAQRDMLEGLAQRRLATFSEQVDRHSTAERQRWHDTTSDRRIALMQADAGLHWSDDALLRRALGTVRAEIRDKAQRHGWDSPLTEAALRQQTSRTLVSAIEAAVERNPERARSLRARYDQHIEATDRAALDALLAEAQTRQRAQQASAEILNRTPPDGQAPTLQWQLQQAEAIAEPAVRAATLRTLHATAAAAEARARALGEQVLARVLKDGLTDPSQIPVREWVALDAERRQAIETRIDHNAVGTEPAPNLALVDELATQMTDAPSAFARRDLVPSVARMPLPQWQRFRELQAGIRRNDPAAQEELYAVKRGLQLITKMLPANTPDDSATNYRAELVEEIDTWRRITGKSPDDAAIVDMLKRRTPIGSYALRSLEGDTRNRPEFLQVRDDTTTYWPNLNAIKRALELVIGAEASRQLNDAMRSMSKGVQGDTKAFAEVVGLKPADGYPSGIITNGEDVYYNPQTGHYLVRNSRGRRGFWIEFDKQGALVGAVDMTLDYPTPRDQLSPEQVKEWTAPETLPAVDPLPPSPPPHVPAPQVPPISTPVPPPSEPQILWTPALPPAKPLILESRTRPPIDEEPRHKHHVIPQQWWREGKLERITFPDEVIDYFDSLIVEVPRSKHWGTLHAAYNREVGRALKAHLEKKAKAHGTTPEDYARTMSVSDARECYREIKKAIRNPDPKKKRDEDELKDSKLAKEFFDRTTSYQQRKSQ